MSSISLAEMIPLLMIRLGADTMLQVVTRVTLAIPMTLVRPLVVVVVISVPLLRVTYPP